METIRIPNTELLISRVVLGTWALGQYGWGAVNEAEMISAAEMAVINGVNCVDTADVYGLGQSEETLGRFLQNHPHLIVATKFGVRWNDAGRTFRDSSPKYVEAALEASLRRLKREYIDLYQIHWPDPRTPIESTLEVLVAAQMAGKIRYIGCSNFSKAQLLEAQRFAEVVSIQSPFNLLDRRIEIDLLSELPLPATLLAYAPLAQGFLTGKHGPSKEFARDDVRSRSAYFSADRRQQYLKCVEQVLLVANRLGRTAGQVAIRWVLDCPGVSAVIVGAKTPTQARENTAIDWRLPSFDHQNLDVVARASLV